MALSFGPAAAADLSGVWIFQLDPDFDGGRTRVECSFKQDGRRLSADCGSVSPMSGEIADRRVTLELTTGERQELTVVITGELDAQETTITGKWHLIAETGKDRDGKFEARRRE